VMVAGFLDSSPQLARRVYRLCDAFGLGVRMRSGDGSGGEDEPGLSAGFEAREAEGRARDLAGAFRRELAREAGFAAAAMSEPRTAAALHPLSERGWRVLHDRRWPGSTRANVDHLAIGPTGVAVLDTKHWSGPIQVRGERLWCGDDDRHESVENLLRLVDAVEELLEEVTDSGPGVAFGLSPVHVLPFFVFTHYEQPNQRAARIGRIRMSTLLELPKLITNLPLVLSPNQVALVGEYLAREMPPAAVIPEQFSPPRPSVIGVPIRPEPPPRPEPVPEAASELFDPAELDEQLTRAAARPLVEWMGFLHPSQVRLVRRCFNGPARVRGPAGTGKTVVLLHRTAWLASTRPGRILVTSFVRTLPHQLRAIYKRLSPDTVDKVDFLGVHELARRLLGDAGQHVPTKQRGVDAAFSRAWERVGVGGALVEICASRQYWREEIDTVIKGRGLRHLVDYERIERRGRVIPLTGRDKIAVWRLLSAYTEELERQQTNDYNDLLSAAVDLVSHARPDPGWSAVLVDEIQDLPLLAVKLCKLLGGTGTDGLFIVGDGQQALYPGGFTLAEAEVSVLGRATVLRVNYRNTRQILEAAQQLVREHDFFDLDPVIERGSRDVDVLRTGLAPIRVETPDRRGLALQLLLALRRDNRLGVAWGEMAVLTNSHADADYLRRFLAQRDIAVRDLASWDGEPDDAVKIDTVHRAKGLDFTAVYLPTLSADRNNISTPDQAERQVRQLCQNFVGHTRARDRLWIGTVRRPARYRGSNAGNVANVE
jgi:Nuclease-related domain/AAA domain/UvrD-like helicase C-terminal domain